MESRTVFDEISDRRRWLLWHNEKFRTELKNLIDETKIKLRPTEPVWRSLQPAPYGIMTGFDHPLWQEFYAKYGIGAFWKDGKVIEKIGEKPLGVEIVKNEDNIEYFRLIIWPGEINKKRIYESWEYIENLISSYFSEKSVPPWNLNIKNFWRDAEWYNLNWLDTHWNSQAEEVISLFEHDELYKKNRLRIHTQFVNKYADTVVYRKIVKYTNLIMPLTIDRLFVENLINKEKGGAKEPLLDEIDPERKEAKNNKYDTLNRLLFRFGILRIASPKIEWGEEFPYHRVSMEKIPDEDFKLKKYGKYYIRYDFLEKERFEINEEEEIDSQRKEKIREKFETEKIEFLFDEKEKEKKEEEKKKKKKAWTDSIFIVKEGIRQMQNRIDSMT